jgi:NAD(P)-dependent dehydrogenase (short-subunit alcohol dehydrogenase family)
MKDFAGKTAFITGGGSGAAFGQAKVFSEAGCKVVIADIRKDHLDEALAYFRTKNAAVHGIQLDVTDRDAYARAADETEKVFGTPELLCLTAGVNSFGPIEKATYDDWDWLLGVNLVGVVNGMVTWVPRMIKAGKGGHIMATSSMGGFFGSAGAGPYSAAKAAVNNMMEGYRDSLKKYNIGVSVLCPANINSRIYEAIKTRPAKYPNSGFIETQETIDTLKNIHKDGMDPVELAQWVKKGIEADQFWILPYPESKRMLEGRFKQIVDSVRQATPEEEERMRKRMEEMRNRPPAAAPPMRARIFTQGKDDV